MFEDSLVESSGRTRTRSKWYALGSFTFEAVALALLILIPYIFPAALPPHVLSSLLVAPPPPLSPAPAPVVRTASARVPASVQLVNLAAPRLIPRQIPKGDYAASPPEMNPYFGNARGSNAISLIAAPPPLPPVRIRRKSSGLVRVSSGVAAGYLLAPIHPIYPAIAKTARIQGTVVIEAIISKQGFVERAHVVSGQPILAQAALAAVSRARYQPYSLNGVPVEVETTISIDFVLGN